MLLIHKLLIRQFNHNAAIFCEAKTSKGIVGFPCEIGLKTKSNFASTIWKGLGKR